MRAVLSRCPEAERWENVERWTLNKTLNVERSATVGHGSIWIRLKIEYTIVIRAIRRYSNLIMHLRVSILSRTWKICFFARNLTKLCLHFLWYPKLPLKWSPFAIEQLRPKTLTTSEGGQLLLLLAPLFCICKSNLLRCVTVCRWPRSCGDSCFLSYRVATVEAWFNERTLNSTQDWLSIRHVVNARSQIVR